MLKYAHKNLTNEETGIKAQVNSTQRGELTSNRSIENSLLNGFTREQHYGAAAKIDELYSIGVANFCIYIPGCLSPSCLSIKNTPLEYNSSIFAAAP